MSGAGDSETFWEEYFRKIRASELDLIKTIISNFKVDFEANFSVQIDLRMIPLIKLLFDKSSIEVKYHAEKV